MRKNMRKLLSWLVLMAMTLAAVCYMPAVDAYAAAPLAYDSFSYSNGTLHNANGGSGWSAPWVVQNNNTTLPGYEIRSNSPLSFANLQTSGGYAVGGRDYLTAGRGLNVNTSGPFSAYLTNGLIGASGKTLYMSFLMRKDADNDQNVHVALHRDNVVTWENPDLVSVGYFGSYSNSGGTRYWTLKLGSNYYRTSVPVTIGETALLVVRMDFGSTNTVRLYVNPSSLGGSAPATASATGTTTSSIAFKSLAFYGGNSTNQCSIDEIRFGASYADVTPVTSSPGTGDGTGLKGEYFDNMNFTNLKLTRTDATVNFDWGSGSPDASIGADTFSVRWTGQVQPLYSQTYTFYTNTDDGVRLWVNNQLIIDKWIDQAATEWSGTIALTAGQKYDIKLEYYENGGEAVAKLLWSSASQAKQVIPQSQLYPAGGTTPPADDGMTMGTNFWNIGWGIWDDTFVPGVDFTTTTNPWRQDFLNEISQYKCLRFMDWTPTNNSTVTNWSQRVSKTSGQTNGVAYEWQIDLCNRIGADMWVCIPHAANWDYSYQLAQLIKNNLRSDLKVYVEYSNETWNGSFSQFQYCIDQGVALNLPGMNQWYKGWAYHVYAAVRHFEQFERVFGTNSDRLVKVIAGQAGYVGPNNTAPMAEHHLLALNDPTVNPKGIKADAYAIAPYMGGNSVQELRNNITTTVQYCQNHLNSLSGSGLKLIAYEGGQHCTVNADTVNRDPAMYQLYIDYFNAMKSKMQGVFCHYLHVGSWGSGGAWGAMEYTGQPVSQAHKYRAILDWISANH